MCELFQQITWERLGSIDLRFHSKPFDISLPYTEDSTIALYLNNQVRVDPVTQFVLPNSIYVPECNCTYSALMWSYKFSAPSWPLGQTDHNPTRDPLTDLYLPCQMWSTKGQQMINCVWRFHSLQFRVKFKLDKKTLDWEHEMQIYRHSHPEYFSQWKYNA